MRVLGVVREYDTPADVKSFYDVQAFYLQRELRAASGIEFRTVTPPGDPVRFFNQIDTESFDHLVGFRLRYIDSHLPPETVNRLRSRMKGAICQFADSPRRESRADLSFVAKDRNDGQFKPYCVIGWAADPGACQSHQTLGGGPFRILIDHPDYRPDRKDITNNILRDIETLRRSNLWKRTGYTSIDVDVLTTPKTERVGVSGPSVPFEEIAKKYWGTHVFIATHKEAIGLSVIEAATSGALVVSQRGFIDETLLGTVRHITYDERDWIPWKLVMASIDPAASRATATQQTWGRVAERLIAGLREFRRA